MYSSTTTPFDCTRSSHRLMENMTYSNLPLLTSPYSPDDLKLYVDNSQVPTTKPATGSPLISPTSCNKKVPESPKVSNYTQTGLEKPNCWPPNFLSNTFSPPHTPLSFSLNSAAKNASIIHILSTIGNVLYSSPTAEQILGHIILPGSSLLDYIHSEDLPEFMSNLSESMSKGTHLTTTYRIKTGNPQSNSYTSMSIQGKPFYDNELLTQNDIISTIQTFMSQQSSYKSAACRGIVLISKPLSPQPSPVVVPSETSTDANKPSNVWDPRKCKSQDSTPSLPSNIPATVVPSVAHRSSSIASAIPSANSTTSLNSSSSPIPSLSSTSSATPVSKTPNDSQAYFPVENNLNNNLENPQYDSRPVISSAYPGNMEAPRTSITFPTTHAQLKSYDASSVQPQPMNQVTPTYWGVNDQGMGVPRKNKVQYSLMPQHFPTQYAAMSQPYNINSSYYLDSSNPVFTGQPVMPEMYDMNAMHRLQAMGQQPLPPAGQTYSPYCQPTAFGYKPNEMLPEPLKRPPGTSYYIRGDLQHSTGGMRGGKRKLRYNSLGMGVLGAGGVYSGHVCSECHVVDSPEWRKGPKGPKTLCNACGLRWAKKSRKESQQRKSISKPTEN